MVRIKLLCVFLAFFVFLYGCKTTKPYVRDYQGINVELIEDEETREATIKFLSKYDILVKLNFQLETKCNMLDYENKTYKKVIDSVDIDKSKKLEDKRDMKPFWYFMIGLILGGTAVGVGVGVSN